MSQLTTAYAAPTGIKWMRALDSGLVEGTGHTVTPKTSTQTVYIGWYSKYKTFQVQWRIRKRLSPSAVEALPDTDSRRNSAGVDVWDPDVDEWPDDWEGDDIDTEAAHTTSDLTYKSGAVICKTGISVPLDYATYDMWRVQVRVRVWDARTLNVSDWGYSNELLVVFVPTVSSATLVRVPAGANLHVVTDWQRSDISACLFVDGQRMTQGAMRNLDGTFDLFIPSHLLTHDADTWKANITELTISTPYSLPYAPLGNNPGEMTAEDYTPTTSLADPTITSEDTGDALQISVVSTGDDYSAVNLSAVWEDSRGVSHSITADATLSGTTWTAEIDTPPYDVPITLRVAVVASDGSFAVTETTVTVPSKGRYTWTYNGEVVLTMRLGVEPKDSYRPDAEAIKPSGSESPVSRYGTGGTRTIEVSGTLLKDDDSDYVPELERLKEKHDWIYRAPDGVRAKVAVTSFSYTSGTGPRRPRSVEISMTEVV